MLKWLIEPEEKDLPAMCPEATCREKLEHEGGCDFMCPKCGLVVIEPPISKYGYK